MRAEFAERRTACPTGHDRLEFHRTNRYHPARCVDCQASLGQAELLDLFFLWHARAEQRIDTLERTLAALLPATEPAAPAATERTFEPSEF